MLTSFHKYIYGFRYLFTYLYFHSTYVHSTYYVLRKASCVCVCAELLSRVWLFATPWTVAHQSPLSRGFSKQDYWSGLPCPSPGDLPDSKIEPMSLKSPALASEFLATVPPGKPVKRLLFSRPVVCNSLWPRRLQRARPPYPEAGPRSWSLHQWCHPAISSSDTLFCPRSFPASGTFPVCRLFSSDDQNTGASASASVLPVSIQGWSPLRLTSLISMLSSGTFRSLL